MIARWGGAATEPWYAPMNVIIAEVDRETGALSDSLTLPERRQLEYFVPGTEPGALRVDVRRLFFLGPLPVF